MSHFRSTATLGLALLTLAGTTAACNLTQRNPAQSGSPAPLNEALRFEPNVLKSAQRLKSFVASPAYDRSNCMEFLTRFQAMMAPEKIQDFDMQALKASAEQTLQTLWETRQAMHEKLAALPENCVQESRGAFRVVRFLEDYIGEWTRAQRPLDPTGFDFFSQPVPIVEKNDAYLSFTANPSEKFEFRNGDLLITRGVSYLSANIARIGTSETQFSHVVFYHRDAASGKQETIESYVGEGVGTYDINYALRNENARIMVLRAKDASLADRAANQMYTRVTQAVAAGAPIQYDFQFEWDNPDKMSCAEVARAAFKAASSNQVVIPQYPSQIQFRNTDYIERIGMGNGWTFAPGDMELDPRFELVAEWRDLRLTRDSRQKDAILTEMFKWMEEKNYVLHDTFTSSLAGKLVWPSSHTVFWPLVRKATGAPGSTPKVPKRVFQTMALLNEVGKAFLGKVKALDADHEKQTGWPMNMTELYQAIEALRSEDLALFQSGHKGRKESVIHRYFRPADLR